MLKTAVFEKILSCFHHPKGNKTHTFSSFFPRYVNFLSLSYLFHEAKNCSNTVCNSSAGKVLQNFYF